MQQVGVGRPGISLYEVLIEKRIFTTKIYGITDSSSSQSR